MTTHTSGLCAKCNRAYTVLTYTARARHHHTHAVYRPWRIGGNEDYEANTCVHATMTFWIFSPLPGRTKLRPRFRLVYKTYYISKVYPSISLDTNGIIHYNYSRNLETGREAGAGRLKRIPSRGLVECSKYFPVSNQRKKFTTVTIRSGRGFRRSSFYNELKPVAGHTWRERSRELRPSTYPGDHAEDAEMSWTVDFV